MAREAKIRDVLPIFSERIAADTSWRNDKRSYHSLLLLARGFNVSSLDEAIALTRAVVGPEDARSPHFETTHVNHATLKPALKAADALPYAGRE